MKASVADADEGGPSPPPDRPGPARPALALVATGATAAVGALILGEYQLRGATAVVAGAVFGLVVGEVAVGIARRQDLVVAVPAALMAGSGLLWAAWIWSGQPWKGVPAGAWTAAGIGVVVTLAWVTGVKVTGPGPPAARNRPGP